MTWENAESMDPKKKLTMRLRRRKRVRKKVAGTAEVPRLSVFRSLRHVYAQLIDDGVGVTLCSASTLEPTVRSEGTATGNTEAAARVGKLLGERAASAGIRRVVFDRNGCLYHGRVRSLAEAAREAGLEF